LEFKLQPAAIVDFRRIVLLSISASFPSREMRHANKYGNAAENTLPVR